MGNYEYARILKAELDLFRNFILDLEEIINQNFAERTQAKRRQSS
jgi:hypothetical protein